MWILSKKKNHPVKITLQLSVNLIIDAIISCNNPKKSPPCNQSSTWVFGSDNCKRSAPISSHWILNLALPNKRCPSFFSCVSHTPAYLLWWILKIKVQRRQCRRLFSLSAGFVPSFAFQMLQIQDAISNHEYEKCERFKL